MSKESEEAKEKRKRLGERIATLTAAILGVSAGGFDAGAQAADIHKDDAAKQATEVTYDAAQKKMHDVIETFKNLPGVEKTEDSGMSGENKLSSTTYANKYASITEYNTASGKQIEFLGSNNTFVVRDGAAYHGGEKISNYEFIGRLERFEHNMGQKIDISLEEALNFYNKKGQYGE